MLAPIFDEAADKVAADFTEPGKVVMGKVDCDKQGGYFYINLFFNPSRSSAEIAFIKKQS